MRLEEFGDVTALVGPNNSGKSNVLRALNLFFNEETDGDNFLDFEVDYRIGPPSKKKKSIRISVEFELPEKFNFRKGLEPVEQLLGRRFWIRKTWTLDSFEPALEIRRPDGPFESVAGELANRVEQFLKLTSFRYIPNRAIPAEVIREQSRGVLRQLAKRLLARGGQDVEGISEAMALVAREMVAPIAEDVRKVCAGVTDLELSTPASVFEMLTRAGFRAAVGPHGRVDDTALGAGVQNLLMFHVLYMIDQGEFQGFGWRQAAVWAIEEPESALHRNLQVRLANLIRAYSLPADSRFQILLSTHNQVFVYGATAGFLVSLGEPPRSVIERRPIGELAREAAAEDITDLPSPALRYPFHTVVLVEGSDDARVLTRARDLTGLCKAAIFISPSLLEEGAADGVQGLQTFVGSQKHVMGQRLSGHPLLALVDWDVSADKVNTIAGKYGPQGTVNVRRMDVAWADPAVGASFRGIERFYPKPFLERAEADGVLTLARTPEDDLVVTPAALNAAKHALADLFCESAGVRDCDGLRPALEWVDAVRQGALL